MVVVINGYLVTGVLGLGQALRRGRWGNESVVGGEKVGGEMN